MFLELSYEKYLVYAYSTYNPSFLLNSSHASFNASNTRLQMNFVSLSALIQ